DYARWISGRCGSTDTGADRGGGGVSSYSPRKMEWAATGPHLNSYRIGGDLKRRDARGGVSSAIERRSVGAEGARGARKARSAARSDASVLSPAISFWIASRVAKRLRQRAASARICAAVPIPDATSSDGKGKGVAGVDARPSRGHSRGAAGS